jgi:ketosteroid isomerase-like protein
MTQENVELAKRFYAAWNARDADALAEMAHPRGEILLPRNLLEGGSYIGPEGIRRALADALETWEETLVFVEEVRGEGDQLAVHGRTFNRPRGGPRTETVFWYAMRFREGKLAYFRPCMTYEEAVDAIDPGG